MSKTALVNALKKHDLEEVRAILQKRPELKELRLDKGVNLLQFSCGRFTGDDPVAASRQLRLAKWLVSQGFDPRENYTTAPGEDGEADSARVSLAWYAVAKAQNNRLARYFLQQGAAPGRSSLPPGGAMRTSSRTWCGMARISTRSSAPRRCTWPSTSSSAALLVSRSLAAAD